MTSSQGKGGPDEAKPIPIHETSRLISSEKVHDTGVFGPDEKRLGTIRSFMIDKVSGQVQYAVLAFGGLLGMGERYFPLPWRELRYDESLGGYIVGLTSERLKSAPSFVAGNEPAFSDQYAADVYDYYEQASRASN